MTVLNTTEDPELLEDANKLVRELQKQLRSVLAEDKLGEKKLIEKFSRAVQKCKVNPEFLPYNVMHCESVSDIQDYLGNPALKCSYRLCEVQVGGIFLSLAAGSSKMAAKGAAVKQAVSVLRSSVQIVVAALTRSWQGTHFPALGVVTQGQGLGLPPFLAPPLSSLTGGRGKKEKLSKAIRQVKEVEDDSSFHLGCSVKDRPIKDMFLLAYKGYNNILGVLRDSVQQVGQGLDLLVESSDQRFVVTVFLERCAVADAMAGTAIEAKQKAVVAAFDFLWKKVPAVSVTKDKINKQSVKNKRQVKALGSVLNLEERQALPEDNLGHKMLVHLGWQKGEGLGMKKHGRLVPLMVEGDGLLRDMETREGVGYGCERRPITETDLLIRSEVDAVLLDHLRKKPAEDLVFGMSGSGFARYEVRMIRQVGQKYGMKAKVMEGLLVMNKKSEVGAVVSELVSCGPGKLIYSHGKRFSIDNKYSVGLEPSLAYQDIRPTSDFPAVLEDINRGVEEKEKKRKEKKDQREENRGKKEVQYNNVKYVYSFQDNNPPRIARKSSPLNIIRIRSDQPPSHKKPLSELEEVSLLLEGKEKNGAMSTWLEAQYLKRWGRQLSGDWMKRCLEAGVVRVGTKSKSWTQIFPVKKTEGEGSGGENSQISTDILQEEEQGLDNPESTDQVGKTEEISIGFADELLALETAMSRCSIDCQSVPVMRSLNIPEPVLSEGKHMVVRLVSVTTPDYLVVQDRGNEA